MGMLDALGDLEKTGKQVAEFVANATQMLQEMRTDLAAAKADLASLREEHHHLHARHEAIMGWLADIDEEAAEELAEAAAESAEEAASAAAQATASAAQAEQSAAEATVEAVVEEAAEEPVAPTEETSSAEGETPPEERKEEKELTETTIPEETAAKPKKNKRAFLRI
jgi:ABC-type transporter Mla subunit MlaD